MTNQEKVRENRLRRMATRRGLLLRKSRVRDRRAIDYGKWYIVDANRNSIEAECRNIDQVEAALND
jgi:hypothetical protein